MIELNEDEALILAQARRALGPTSADQQRILQALLPQLTPTPSVAPGSSMPGSSWTTRAMGAIAVIGAIALSGGLGYRKGFEAGIDQKNKPPPQPNARVAASTTPVQTTPELERPAPSGPPLASAGTRMPAIPARRRSASSAESAPSEPVSPLGLDEEVRQLRRVERAIRESNPRLALVLLEDLQRELPAGQLLEERRAAAIMANCQLGADAAVADARAFATKHARSAYLTRVIEICGLEGQRNSVAPGTHVPR